MAGPILFSIPPGTLDIGQVPFDIFVPDGTGRLKEFCIKGERIDVPRKQKLEENSRPYYILRKDILQFVEYTRTRLEKIVENRRIRIADKATIIYLIGKHTVNRILSLPDELDVFAEARSFNISLVDAMRHCPELGRHLFALSSMDVYRYSHAVNVAILNVLIGQFRYGDDRNTLLRLGLAGLLHDVGKSRIDSKILNKPGRLTDIELEIAQRHAEFSYQILKKQMFEEEVAEAGRFHHERLDGSGYPHRLTGDQVPEFARITAVSDVYDAITSNKIYRDAKTHIEALTEMSQMSGKLDTKVFDTLLEVVFQNQRLIDQFRENAGFFDEDEQTSALDIGQPLSGE